VHRVFLDANVLFSAAYDQRRHISRLWQMRNIELVTSPYAAAEAFRNKDIPILLAAIAAEATHLVTGDRHFEPLFGRTLAGVKIVTPADYLRQAEYEGQ
jgi:predicted nucleic acid-binding protein